MTASWLRFCNWCATQGEFLWGNPRRGLVSIRTPGGIQYFHKEKGGN